MTIAQIAAIFAAVVPTVFDWIMAVGTGDANAANEAQFKVANTIADEVEKAKFPNG